MVALEVPKRLRSRPTAASSCRDSETVQPLSGTTRPSAPYLLSTRSGDRRHVRSRVLREWFASLGRRDEVIDDIAIGARFDMQTSATVHGNVLHHGKTPLAAKARQRRDARAEIYFFGGLSGNAVKTISEAYFNLAVVVRYFDFNCGSLSAEVRQRARGPGNQLLQNSSYIVLEREHFMGAAVHEIQRDVLYDQAR